MKTFTSVNQTTNQCESTLKSSSSLWLLLLQAFTSLAKRSQVQQLIVLACREVHAGLVALRISKPVNNRLFVGFLVLLVAAPLSTVGYQLFDNSREGMDLTWYHLNFYHLFHLLSPHLFIVTSLIGVFFLFPEGSKRAWFIILPMGYTIAKIIWLIQVTNNNEFHQVAPLYFIITGVLIAFLLLFTFQWLIHRKFHSHDALIARISGIINTPGIPSEQRTTMLNKTVSELKSFSSQY